MNEGLIEAIKRTQAVVRFTPEGVVMEANDVFLNIMGYTLAEVVGKHHRMFMDANAASRPEYTELWAGLAAGKERHGDFFMRLNKSGQAVWLSASYTPVKQDGKVTSVVKLAHDITADKLRHFEMEAQIAAIDKTQAVVVFDTNKCILSANGNFLKVMGYSREEVIGKPHKIFMPEQLPADYDQFWSKLVAGEFQTGEFTRYGKGGRKVFLQAVYTPILQDGKVSKIIKFALDVTEERTRTLDYELQISGIRQTQVSPYRRFGSIQTFSLTIFFFFPNSRLLPLFLRMESSLTQTRSFWRRWATSLTRS